MIKPRMKCTPQQKFEIVKEGLLSGAQISEVCRRHGISTGWDLWVRKIYFKRE